jgi:translation initiation factor IF-2
MNDRMRVYELARQMNIPNEDVITTLRELGHDIKSHSSTVDKAAVGQLISALNKKKQQPEKPDNKGKGVKTAAKTATKAPPPPPPVVKPRVLSRTRPTPLVVPGSEVAAGVTEMAPAASTAVATPLTEEVPVTQVPPNGHPAAAEPTVSGNGAQPTLTPLTVASTSVQETPVVVPVPAETEKPEPEVVQPVAAAAASVTEEKEQKGDKAEVKVDKKDSDGEGFTPPNNGQPVKPMAPSVPVRIAAPSVRATPPRPPKSHRPTPSERHAAKKDERSRPTAPTPVEVPRIITLTNSLTVKELAEKMNVADTEVIKRLFMRGFPRTVNQTVEYELAKDLAIEMEYEVLSEDAPSAESLVPEKELTAEEQASLVLRPPVVTIMGHVDHGKTSLLDAIRQTKFLLTASEAGGITQHIGAYHVEVESEDGTMRQIVFLDTPGHEAFTAMRARGAKATDIAILVVAADDGVMPQTIEAIDHAKAAGVPIIVAVNKIDKADSDPDRVLTQLMEHGLLPDKFGGETVTVNVSAKKRTGLDELLEMILLVADIQDLRANPDKPATGVIIEAELSRGKGAVATALVENGTLREGDYIVAGSKSGRVRALFDDRGQRVKAAGPSMPVEVLGLDEVPQAGDRFEVCADVHASKILIEQRKLNQVERKQHHVSLESLHEMLTKGEVKELNVIVKADVQGTAEAIAEQVKKLSGNEVAVRVLRTASGDISENDVNLAASSEAIIIGFNVNPDQNARQVAESAGVDIRTYSIIYQITDDLEKAIQGLIQPIRKEVKIGVAEVRQIFKFGKALMIGGCMVTEGKVQRGCIAKIERNGAIVHEGKLDTLKRFKDDVKEVAQGFECGMSFEKFSDLQEGDKINAFIIQESKGEITR